MHAVRNISHCTKDCICLYVCPTGATDTETGQIDAKKCIGCGRCMNACPSHAIVMIPEVYPKQQGKTEEVIDALTKLAVSKTNQEQMAKTIALTTENPLEQQLMTAFATSNRIMAEDLLRESGYMLPQSEESLNLLKDMLEEADPKFPKEAVEELLTLLEG